MENECNYEKEIVKPLIISAAALVSMFGFEFEQVQVSFDTLSTMEETVHQIELAFCICICICISINIRKL